MEQTGWGCKGVSGGPAEPARRPVDVSSRERAEPRPEHGRPRADRTIWPGLRPDVRMLSTALISGRRLPRHRRPAPEESDLPAAIIGPSSVEVCREKPSRPRRRVASPPVGDGAARCNPSDCPRTHPQGRARPSSPFAARATLPDPCCQRAAAQVHSPPVPQIPTPAASTVRTNARTAAHRCPPPRPAPPSSSARRP